MPERLPCTSFSEMTLMYPMLTPLITTLRVPLEILAIDAKDNSLASASIYTNYAGEGEEAAIALAVASTIAKTIVSDSKTALRYYEIGRISNITHFTPRPSHSYA